MHLRHRSTTGILVSGCIFLVLTLTSSASAQISEPGIIPTPQSYTWQDGVLVLSSLHRIVLGRGTTDADRFATELLQEELGARGIGVRVEESGQETPVNGSIVIAAGGNTRNDEYRLIVSAEGARIEGSGAQGRFYGAMSLLQLIRASHDEIRAVDIHDYPELELRGISDDLSRGQVSTLENFKEIVRFHGEHKMNVYMPYIEDVFQFEEYPSIGKGRGALSKNELIELQDYADKYHVQIIPIFQTLGHYENILTQPEFAQFAEFPGAASLNTQNPEAYEFLEDLLDEIVPVFRSEYFHIGADESWDVGKGASAEAVDREGIISVHARHYRRVYDLVAAHGKKVIMYADMPQRHPSATALTEIPEDVILFDWQYAATDHFPSVDMLGKAERSFIIGGALQNWRRVYPNQSAAWANIYHATLEGYRGGAIGSISSSWNDEGAPNFRELNYRGFAYTAECAWNPDGAARASIDSRFNRLFYGVDAHELHSIVALLTRLSHDVYFSTLWEHPFHSVEKYDTTPEQLPFPTKAWPVIAEHRELPLLVRSYFVQGSADAVQRAVTAVRDQVTAHREHLDYHAFVSRLAHWFGERLEYAQWMTDIRRDFAAGERTAYVDRGVSWGEALHAEASALQDAFRSLWLRTNREAGLDRIAKNFDYQAAYLDEMIISIRDGSWDVKTTINSRYIAAAAGGATSYLRKTFLVDEGAIEAAYLQLTGDSNVELWLNGETIGRVIGRGTLSLMVKRDRVKTWNVADRLRSGTENVIAAKATSYGTDAPGSANIYLEIHYADGRVHRVTSDAYWKSHHNPSGDWTRLNYADQYWQNAVVLEAPERLSMPMFDRGLPSRIE